MPSQITLGRYDIASFAAYIVYAVSSLAIPLTLVEMGRSLAFPLDQGGMTAGGGLHLVRSLAMVIAIFVSSLLAWKLGKRGSMGCSMLLIGGGVMLCALAPGYWVLVPALLVAGFGEGICEAIATPFVQDLHPQSPERHISIAHSMWSVGIALSVLLTGGLLSSGVNWRLILGCCGSATLLVSLLFLWKENPEKRYVETRDVTGVAEIRSDTLKIVRAPRFWVISAAMFMGAGAEFCLTFWSSAYLKLNFNAGAWAAGLGTGAIALGMFVGRTASGYFARKDQLKRLLLISGIATIPVSLLLIFITPELIPNRMLLFGLLFFVLFLCGIGIAPYWPTLQVYGVTTQPELNATLLYIYYSVIGIPGCGFFTWLMGVLGDRFGLRAGFLLIPGSLVIFSLILVLDGWLFKPRPTKITFQADVRERSEGNPALRLRGRRWRRSAGDLRSRKSQVQIPLGVP